MFSVDLEVDGFPHVLAETPADHFLKRDLDVDALIMQAGVELGRVVLSLRVERVAQVSVKTDPEVIVHDEDLQIIKMKDSQKVHSPCQKALQIPS